MSTVTVKLTLKNGQWITGLDESQKKSEKFAKSVEKGFSKLGAALAGLGIVKLFNDVIDRGAEIKDLGERFDVPTEALQRMGNAAEQNGSSMEAVAKAFNKVIISQDQALDGNAQMVDAFKDLGISIDDLWNMTPEELMRKIGKGAMDAAALVKVLGKNAIELRPMLGALEDFSTDGVIKDKDVQNLGTMKDMMAELSRVVQSSLAPAVSWVAEKFIQIVQAAQAIGAFLGAASVDDEGGFKGPVDAFNEAHSRQVEGRFAKGGGAKGRSTVTDKASQKREDKIVEANEKYEDKLQEIADKKQKDEYDAMKKRANMTGVERAEERHKAAQAKRDESKADREFARKHGKDALKEFKDKQDPAKQAKAAYDKALEKIDKIKDELSDIKDSIDDLEGPAF